jgi:hypothetical protein
MLGDSAPGLMGMAYAEGSGARLLRDPRHRPDLAFSDISSDQPESTFCPSFAGCEVVLSVFEGATLLAESSARLVDDFVGASMSTNVTVPATLGPHTYTLKMKTRGGVDLDSKNQRLSAVTSTFGSTGGATLSSGGDVSPRAGG